MTDRLVPAGRDNMRQLVELRWLAVGGQLITVLTVRYTMGVPLPIAPMLAVIFCLVALNLYSGWNLRRGRVVAHRRLLGALLIDVGALTALLYLSGGATNPFVWLFLLQVVLGAVLLEAWASWLLVLVTSACFVMLVATHEPLALPPGLAIGRFDLYLAGALISFGLIAVLLVLFVTRINANLRRQDAEVAAMRQHAAEEDHIVRMGLLASGAAHELGTPLASLSVILNDWARTPRLARDAELAEEIEDMQAALARCKSIVTGILLSAGEARGDDPAITTVRRLLDDIAEEWRQNHPGRQLDYGDRFGTDVRIVSDTALRQAIINVLDNAAEASDDTPVQLLAARHDDDLVLDVVDRGPGFTDEMLAHYGKPYTSTKGRQGGGLGLFLVVNVMRKLGGTVSVHNRAQGGALVTLRLPLAALSMGASA